MSRLRAAGSLTQKEREASIISAEPMDLKQHIRHVPDFPKPGILFYDITTLLRNPGGLKATIDRLSEPYEGKAIDAVIGIESRGFILGAAVAERLGAGFIPIRKPGKLPAKSLRESYALEYGSDALEIHEDAIQRGQRILIVDDVLATGGTAAAAAGLVKQLGGDLHGLAFLIELLFLSGKSKLPGEQVYSVLQY
jgi:adenine phosphoribosyltransferase